MRSQSFMSEFNCSYFGVLLLSEMKEIMHTATKNLPMMASHLCTTRSHKIQKMRTYHNSYTVKDVQKNKYPKCHLYFLELHNGIKLQEMLLEMHRTPDKSQQCRSSSMICKKKNISFLYVLHRVYTTTSMHLVWDQ